MSRNRRSTPRQRVPASPGGAFEPAASLPPYDAPPLDSAVGELDQQRGHEFIRLFNEIDHHIRRVVGSSGGESFFRRLQWSARDNPALKRYQDDLMEYAELRNALVHDRRFPNRMIAVPVERTLADFRRLVERVVRPRRVLPAFGRDLRVFAPEEPLSAALDYMHQQGYTQIVAREAGVLRLATAAAVTRWLTARLAGADGSTATGSVDLAGARVGDVLALEKPEALGLIGRDATVEEALDVFQQSLSRRRGRLYALLITEHGAADEAPLGIITPADLLDEG